MSDSLKKNNKKQAIHLLAHFVWATWTILSQSLILYERPEQIAYITHFWLAPWAIRLFVLRDVSKPLTLLFKKRNWGNH